MSRSWRGLGMAAIAAVVCTGIAVAAPLAWGLGQSRIQVPAASHAEGNAGTSGNVHQPQPYSNADLNGHGANPGAVTNPNVYRSTRNGSPSLNGNGNGQANGKPCAGCVGRADNKNPPGQQPGRSGHNAGYECDRNRGIGQTNPAHTGCVTPMTSPASSTTSTTGSSTTTTTRATTTTVSPATTTTATTAGGSATTLVGSTTTLAGSTTTGPTVAFAAGSGPAPATLPAVVAALPPAGAARQSRPALAGARSGGAATAPARSSGILAFTGSNTTVSVLIALFLLTAGAAATVLARRRPPGRS